ncbi:MAG: EAL domain-containing response regulator [Pseudomonadota bacterium]
MREDQAESHSPSTAAATALTVLVVDDDPIFRTLMTDVLEDCAPCRVMTASDGLAGLQILELDAESIDVVTLDLSMPNCDGVEFLRLLSETRFHGRLVLISGELESIRGSAAKLAKMLGLDCFAIFEKPVDFRAIASCVLKSASLQPQPTDTPRINIEEINSGLRNSRLYTVYQPRINLQSGQLAGVEVLARMRNEEGRLFDAGQMINLAEQNGKITDITWRVIERICDDCASLFPEHDERIKVSFNVSGSILSNSQFPDQLSDMIHFSEMKPDNFIVELTETRLPEDASLALESLTRLRILGFGLAIDDFGTGYSSIAQLKMYPFTELKIDKSFMIGAKTDTFSKACVEASVSLARELNLNVVAEGIEDRQTLDLAKAYGIGEGQGYLLGKPMTFDDFLAYKKNFSADSRFLPEEPSMPC